MTRSGAAVASGRDRHRGPAAACTGGEQHGRATLRLLAMAALAAIGFQVVHVTDHALQVLVWLVQPGSTAWLTPWAATGAATLGHVTGAGNAGGVELLHLGGNVVFLAGLAVAGALLAGARERSPRSLRLALWIQGAHVAEHVLLTATWFLTGSALGLSTAFGALAADPVVATALRVWFHFTINGVATVLAVRGLRSAWPVLHPLLTRSSSSRAGNEWPTQATRPAPAPVPPNSTAGGTGRPRW